MILIHDKLLNQTQKKLNQAQAETMNPFEKWLKPLENNPTK